MKKCDIFVDDSNFKIDPKSVSFPEAYAMFIRISTQWKNIDFYKPTLQAPILKKLKVCQESSTKQAQAELEVLAKELSDEVMEREKKIDAQKNVISGKQNLLDMAYEEDGYKMLNEFAYELSNEVEWKDEDWNELEELANELTYELAPDKGVLNERERENLQEELVKEQDRFVRKMVIFAARKEAAFEGVPRVFCKDEDVWGSIQFLDCVDEAFVDILEYASLDREQFVDYVMDKFVETLYKRIEAVAKAVAKKVVSLYARMSACKLSATEKEDLTIRIMEKIINQEFIDPTCLQTILEKINYNDIFIDSIEHFMKKKIQNVLSRESYRMKRDYSIIASLDYVGEEGECDIQSVLVDTNTPEEEVVFKDFIHCIENEISTPTDNKQSVDKKMRIFWLRYFCELKKVDIAERVGVSPQRVGAVIKEFEEILARYNYKKATKEEKERLKENRKKMQQRQRENRKNKIE